MSGAFWLCAALLLALALTGLAWWRTRQERETLKQQLAARQNATRANVPERSVAEERERIFADLHDDIGAKLLTLVHTAENAAQADLARSTLQDLRDIVSRARSAAEGTLLEVLAQIRYETSQRLGLMKGALAWEQQADLPDPALDEGQALHLYRIVREAVSNALRHAHASRIRIRVKYAEDELLLDVTDDGAELMAKAESGSGLTNMKNRAEQLHGQISWQPGTAGGTKVLLRFPLPAVD